MDGQSVVHITCTSCNGQGMQSARVRSAFWHDERLVVVDDIPALVCDRCGEQFYDDSTAMSLDLLRGSGFPPEQARSELTVAVFSFSDAARLAERP